MSKNLKILVVDDNEEFCMNVKDILELKDYAVATAFDGFKALDQVKGNGFDLILMDIKMPVMDGVDTFKKIKEIAPTTPVIMITAYAVEDLIREALKEGAFAALKKPLDFDGLLDIIDRVISDGALLLVVDDDEDLCRNMKDVLEDKRYRVTVAYDGETAIQKARENPFDIMLIDMKLPTLNGLETYLAVRDIRPNMVAIIITGYSMQMGDLVEQAFKGGAYTCLEKPIDMEELLSLLGKIEEEKAKGTFKKPE
ncbi:MAG: response regulator [Desulfobacteraceae bacterium]|nr:response regulator [Desulfobacteraceae bacterium]